MHSYGERRRQIWPWKVLTKTILSKLAPDILLGPRRLLVNAGSGEMPDSRENGDQSQGGADLFYFCTYIDLHWLTMLWKRAGLPHSAQCCNDRSTLGHPGQHRPTQWLCDICMSTQIQKLERAVPPWLWWPFSREPDISPLPAFTSSLLGPRRMFGASLDQIGLVITFQVKFPSSFLPACPTFLSLM